MFDDVPVLVDDRRPIALDYGDVTLILEECAIEAGAAGSVSNEPSLSEPLSDLAGSVTSINAIQRPDPAMEPEAVEIFGAREAGCDGGERRTRLEAPVGVALWSRDERIGCPRQV